MKNKPDTEIPVLSPERKMLFIVNPNSGKKNSGKIVDMIKSKLNGSIACDIAVWSDKNNFGDIENKLRSGIYTDAIAVGGDGTVNQVAKNLVNTQISLGIIPVGSGNGLARSLGVSMNIDTAIEQVIGGKKSKIDHGTVNGIPFFCTSGVGFDAHIGALFARSVKRGLQSYVKITIAELFRYRAGNYTISFNSTSIKRKAFLITVANAGQYGNDFYIAPQASMRDGKFHLVVLKPFNAIKVLGILGKVLNRRANESKSIETYTASSFKITRDNGGSIHFDGEPAIEGKELVYNNNAGSLNVIVGDQFLQN